MLSLLLVEQMSVGDCDPRRIGAVARPCLMPRQAPKDDMPLPLFQAWLNALGRHLVEDK
jgi:hypothetical protein